MFFDKLQSQCSNDRSEITGFGLSGLEFLVLVSSGVLDRGAGGQSPPLDFGKLVKFGQMGWEIRAFRGLNFSR